MFKKITVGFVIQEFNEQGKCVHQEFIAGDQVDWEDEMGDPISVREDAEYQSFEMVQPK